MLTPEYGAGIARGLVRAEGLGVSYLRAGEGPPVVLLHTGAASARMMVPLLERLAHDHTVLALDLPGYGDSDRLPGSHLTARRLSKWLGATLDALKVKKCVIFGSHTGAAIAMELGRGRPELASALILEGPCLFSAREIAFFTSEKYLAPFEIHSDGSHLFASWVKLRDQVTWFPWCVRSARNRRLAPLIPIEILQVSIVDILRAGDAYRNAYRAGFEHDGYAAASALKLPATFAAHRSDVLYSHLDRLPKLRPNQGIVRGPSDTLTWIGELAEIIRGYRSGRPTPPPSPLKPTPGAVNRRYVDGAGGQILVRSSGESRRGRPLLLLHDGRASSRMFEPLMRALAQRRPVYSPDLPGNGASDRFVARRPAISAYAETVADTIVGCGLGPCDIYAVGASAGIALELTARRELATGRVVLDAPDFYAKPLAAQLAREWAPPLEPAWDGSHLNRLWLMLRDEFAFWPWFDKTNPVAVDAPADWDEFHACVADVVRSMPTYHQLTEAAMRYDWRAALRVTRSRNPIVAATAQEPRRLHAVAAAERSGLGAVAELPSASPAKAGAILDLLDR
jgi:pimeloyl-ACP methyl ester carboxylesterase